MNHRPFHTLMVANRGEIAVRVFRTARALGYRCVAVFSEADRDSPHVADADEAVCIGAAAASESYLNVEALLAAAQATGTDAIHPGYGFLSEDADFAQACIDAGLVWVGPPPEAIRAMGDKAQAKARMQAASVPTVPGYDGADQGAERMQQEADRIGYPLLVKAVGGGGGRGMRLVREANDLAEALQSAGREAASAFGNDVLLLEAFVENARHIEIQVFADSHGSVVHLGERDCTTQRRRQKVIEEAPSPALTDELRAQMGTDAVQAARAIDYVGAGTVEMILSADGRHFFLEMNTRLQVEHPVTELVTGLDLVEWQLRVASGEPLPRTSSVQQLSGHAIQARLYAEDPSSGFTPQVGDVRWFRPAALADRPAIRIDAGIREGGAVTPHYDPMVAKVLAHGRDRADATRRLARALQDLPLAGLRTNRDFLVRVLRHEAFEQARITTGTLDDWASAGHDVLSPPTPAPRTLALGAALLAGAHDDWFRSTSAASLTVRLAEPEERALQVSAEGDQVRVVGDDVDVTLAIHERGEGWLRYTTGGVLRRAFALPHDGGWSLDDGAGVLRFVEASPYPADAAASDPSKVRSHVAGTVVRMAVAPGDEVDEGQVVAIVEAMKMETPLVARAAGTVAEVHAAVGDQIESDTTVAELSLPGDA
ncbi:MAG: ATP-grasp domain-containing protein [Myxococcales bacterium]|nr:ATP-grasp domain-containing protein [Myxococcales bacterium]